jgi:hypothetical protein
MDHFEFLHDPAKSNVLDQSTDSQAFEDAYTVHIKKLLLTEKKSRYLAKGNYNLTRLQYIKKLFPDARFIIAIRKPETHIASLLKQHYLFSTLEQENKRVLNYMNHVGHFEFGLNFTPLNTGDCAATDKIRSLMNNGHQIEALASYWSMIYDFVSDRILTDPSLENSVMIVRYEDLCNDTKSSLKKLGTFCGMSEPLEEPPSGISLPGYYQSGFSNTNLQMIRDLTAKTEALFYND